jgi:hypothetical protein
VKSAVLLFTAVTTSAFAQNHPMPGAKWEPPVICAGCPGNNSEDEPNDGKPTYPYDTPLKMHAGRYVDSSDTPPVNSGMRTVRAGIVRMAPIVRNRIYIAMTGTLSAYTYDTFFTEKLRQPMVPVNVLQTGMPYGERDPFEKLALPDRFFYPEATSSGWQIAPDSGAAVLDFDADDRGYVYLATSHYGWGILSDPGGSDSSLLPSVYHRNGVSPLGKL